MIEFVGATFLVIGFIFFLKIFRLVDKSTRVINISKSAVADLRSAVLDEEAKEAAMQSYAKELFKLFVYIAAGGMIAVLLPAAVIWLLDTMRLVSMDGVFATALSWQFLIAATGIMLIVIVVDRLRN